MKIKLIAVGTKMPAWVTDGFQDYHKRLPPHLQPQLIEINAPKRGKQLSAAQAMATEGEQILAKISPTDQVIALHITGTAWDTPKLSEQLHQWQQQGDDIVLLIGGPDGLAKPCLDRANQHWSLSALTLPHPLVRIVLAEQLYRAWSLLNRHPYHR